MIGRNNELRQGEQLPAEQADYANTVGEAFGTLEATIAATNPSALYDPMPTEAAPAGAPAPEQVAVLAGATSVMGSVQG